MQPKSRRFYLSRGFRMLLAKYLAFTLVPLILLLSCVGLLLRDSFEDRYLSQLRDSLDAAQSQVSYSLKAIDAICVSIDQSDSIVSSMLDINAYSRVNVCKLLNTYSILDSLYTDLCLFSAQTPELIYSPIGTDLLTNLASYDCFPGEASPSAQLLSFSQRSLFSNLAATDDAPLTAAQLRHNHSLLYVCPGKLFSTSAATVLLRIKTNTFYALYDDALRMYAPSEYALITLDTSGQIIGMDGLLYESSCLVSPCWLDEQLHGGNVAAVQTAHETFTQYLLIDRSVVTAAVAPQVHNVRIVSTAAALLALIVCFAVARQIYRPVAMLRESILAGVSEMPIDSAALQGIDQSIADIIQTYNHREEQSRRILDMMKQQLVYWALLNSLPRTEHTEQLLKLTGFNQPNMLFCALTIQLPSSTDPTLVANLCADIQRLDWNHSDAIAVWVPDHDTLAVVFHMFVELDTRMRQEYAANALHMLLDQYSIISGVGVGLSQPTLFTLNRSYTTARRALCGPSMPYCLFEDLNAQKRDQFSDALNSLIIAINDSILDQAHSELTHCLRMLEELSAKRALQQFYSARLLNELSRPFIEFGLWDADQLNAEIERLMFMNPAELSATLGAALDQIAAVAPPHAEEAELSAKDSILAGVYASLSKNALDPMLNVNLEAEKYGMSTVTLNRRFRQRYGMSMVNFVSEIRITKAKELLRDSDMRIKDIVTAVGYFDVPNFSRKFKATVGLTPSQYRQQERGGCVDDDEE